MENTQNQWEEEAEEKTSVEHKQSELFNNKMHHNLKQWAPHPYRYASRG